MNVNKMLIDKAVEKVGSLNELAQMTGMNPNRLSQQRNGHDKMSPIDIAVIAHLAGFNAMNVLAAATLEKTAGTKKGALLDEALGKQFPDLKKSENSASVRLIQCILC